MRNFLFILFAFILVSCQDKPTNQNELVGWWQLNSMEKWNEEKQAYQEWRPKMRGNLLYDNNNHVTLHLFDAQFENYSPAYPSFDSTISLSALKNNTRSYFYMGTYTLKQNNVVAHTRISHANPKDFGVTVERKFHLKNDTLIMQPVEKSNANLQLKWVRYE